MKKESKFYNELNFIDKEEVDRALKEYKNYGRVTLRVVALLYVLLALYFIPWPENFYPGFDFDDKGKDFQRIGSIIVAISLLFEFLRGNTTEPFKHDFYHERRMAFSEKIKNNNIKIQFISYFTSIAGTIIWGYGDKFYPFLV